MAMVWTMLAAAVAAAPAPDAAADTVDGLEVVTRAPIVGDLQKGITNYRPEYFTPVRPTTAMDMVTWLPGFFFEDTRDVRGLGGSAGNVLIDGKPTTSKTDTLQNVLKRIPAEQVDRVDLIVGGAPGIDMRGHSVVANVILKVRPRPQRVVSASSQIDEHGRASPAMSLSSSLKRDGRSTDAALDIFRNLAILPGYGYGTYQRRGPDGALVYRAGASQLAGGTIATASASHEFPFHAGRLRFNGAARYYATIIDTAEEVIPGPERFTYREDNTYWQGELGVRYERSFGRTTLETQSLNRFNSNTLGQLTRRPGQDAAVSQDSDWREHIGRAVARFKRDDSLTLEASAEGTLNRFDNQGAIVAGPGADPISSPDTSVSERRGEVGAGVIWKPNGRFNLDTALKVEASSLTAMSGSGLERRFFYLKPKATLTWTPDADTQVRLRAEHEVGQLSFFYFINFQEASGQFIIGNTGLRPPRTFALEAVVQRRFWNGADLAVTLRRRALKDVVDPVPFATSAGYAAIISNIGDGSASDFIANLTLPLKRFGLDRAMLKATVTASRLRVIDPTTGLRRPLSGQPELVGELHFTHDLPRWSLNWGVDAFYRGTSTVYRPFGTTTVAAFPRFNIFVERRFGPATTLRLEAQALPGHRIRQTIAAYGGLRGAAAPLFTDDRFLAPGPLAYVKLRRTFQ